ncbi:hypothetical protein [Mesorhizobium xinjiangense]|uniref:hypothetical protein n=1 Tax=Mesorhizobium xinjiangense TaxID=2678685 RepID=UPI001F239A10|nr:hypothetical protein [Mesorhizobium xinjiangense]
MATHKTVASAIAAAVTALLSGVVWTVPGNAEEAASATWRAGAYSFSDEKGGFRILAVSGRGTADDPVVIDQEFYSASPVTLVIRTEAPIKPHAVEEGFVNGFLYVLIVARNASELAWTEFEFELQEVLGQPSVFGDGLSFDQRRTEGDNLTVTGFSRFSRDFEPYDRLLFRDGFVDPGEMAQFGFLISDFTPVERFFLVQDPRIPSS